MRAGDRRGPSRRPESGLVIRTGPRSRRRPTPSVTAGNTRSRTLLRLAEAHRPRCGRSEPGDGAGSVSTNSRAARVRRFRITGNENHDCQRLLKRELARRPDDSVVRLGTVQVTRGIAHVSFVAERPNPNGTVFSDSFEETSPSLPFSDLIQRPPGHFSLGLLLVVPKLIELPQHRARDDKVELAGAILPRPRTIHECRRVDDSGIPGRLHEVFRLSNERSISSRRRRTLAALSSGEEIRIPTASPDTKSAH